MQGKMAGVVSPACFFAALQRGTPESAKSEDNGVFVQCSIVHIDQNGFKI